MGAAMRYITQWRGDNMTANEQKEWDLKLRKMDSEIANLNAATAKLISENRWYLLIVGSGVTLAIVAVVKIFL
tara:strand:+ start:398 stop:616 length:219 start_codon:yes stop_codon:yes gene_type:complete